MFGVAKDMLLRVEGVDPLEKMLGVSPSMRVFGLGFSDARLVASRSR